MVAIGAKEVRKTYKLSTVVAGLDLQENETICIITSERAKEDELFKHSLSKYTLQCHFKDEYRVFELMEAGKEWEQSD